MNNALRPLEWFNLAVLHGPFEYHLHDDFYDDQGTALAAEIEVADADELSFPLLRNMIGDVQGVTDYSLTQWWLRDDVIDALMRVDKQLLLEEVVRRHQLTTNPWKQERLYAICGKVLGQKAREWITEQFEGLDTSERIKLLWVAADCFHKDDALQRTFLALADIPRNELHNQCMVLAQFRDRSILSWIEANITDPLTHNWGDLAACSMIDWDKVREWIGRGRPLSLIAIDALAACNGPRANQSPLMKQMAPKLQNAAAIEEMTQCLLNYAKRDSVPRVELAVKAIIKSWPRISGRVSP